MMLEKVNSSEKLGAVPFELADAENMSPVEPVLATPAAVAWGVCAGVAAFGTGVAICWAVNQ